MRKQQDFVGATAAQALETLVTVHEDTELNGEFDRLVFELGTLGGTAAVVDQFALAVKTHPNGSYHTIISDWSSVVAEQLIFKSGTLNTLAHATDEMAMIINLLGVHAIRFQVAFAAGGADIVTTVRGRLMGLE